MCVDATGASDPLVRAIVQGLGDHNALWFAEHPEQPSPLSAGISYVGRCPVELVTLLDAQRLYAAREGSCGSLSAALYGYLRSRDQPALLLTTRPEPHSWHVVVRLPSGTIWDPAKDVQHAA